jgi:hypothetical protein
MEDVIYSSVAKENKTQSQTLMKLKEIYGQKVNH